MKNKKFTIIIIILIVIIISSSIFLLNNKKIGQKIQDITGINPYNDIMTPSGIKNNNPLNIRHSSSVKWQGEIVDANTKDGDFAKFSSLDYGIRAAIVNLHTYVTKDGINTIHSIINKWAPPTENDDASYENIVMKQLSVIYPGLTSTTIINGDYTQLSNLAWAMSAVELGYKNQPSRDTFINVQKKFF